MTCLPGDVRSAIACSRLLITVVPLLAACLATAAVAETQYISDQLVVRLRSSVEQSATVVATVQTDDPVEVIEQRPDGLVKVRTMAGEEGWLHSRYLTTDLPKLVIINQLQQQLEHLRALHAGDTDGHLQEMVATLTTERAALTEQNALLQQQLMELTMRLDQQESAAPVTADLPRQQSGPESLDEEMVDSLREELLTLREQYDALLMQNLELAKNSSLHGSFSPTAAETRIAALIEDNRALQSSLSAMAKDRSIYWLIAGAVILLIGMVIGSLSARKKRRLLY